MTTKKEISDWQYYWNTLIPTKNGLFKYKFPYPTTKKYLGGIKHIYNGGVEGEVLDYIHKR